MSIVNCLARVTQTGVIVAGIASTGVAADPPGVRTDAKPRPYEPNIARASDEGMKAIRSFQPARGITIELFAAEPLLANPVAFCTDGKGVFYVAETFRHSAGVPDTRGHMDWLNDDLACRNVADRLAMYKKYLGKGFAEYLVEHERVRRIVDTDGDGRADSATVFADGFNDPTSGIGAGLLARKSDVWYTCIPALWKLRDNNGDGRADERTILQEGYGVHVGFLGHDLHGLRMGPDGRLYFSIGDRGLNVKTREGRVLDVPDTGAILRCEPDGTKLEVFATGLRNPQELAFDQFGNLFTADNNSDSGDRARFVQLLEGGDSGWRIGYQWFEAPYSRGPWNEEQLWYPPFAGQAAWILPPVANVADGPSGLTYDPGVSLLPEEFKNHFFLVDFRGASGQSGIRTFSLEPQGSSFKLVNSRQFVWSVLATDVDFGPDGAFYTCDWVEGWDKPNKGRIYRMFAADRRDDPLVKEVKTLLAAGMGERSVQELAGLLSHPDSRVRQDAQFELAERGDRALENLTSVARSGKTRLARIHAVWGLGQILRAGVEPARGRSLSVLGPLVRDPDSEVRAQTAKVLGDAVESSAIDGLIRLLSDPEPRPRMLAAIALGALRQPGAIEPLVVMLRAAANADPYLRHAAVMGLFGSSAGKPGALKKWASDPLPAVRMGILLAWRRAGDASISEFLNDSEPGIVLEAARAINDAPITPAQPALAAVALGVDSPLPLARRVLNANFRLGLAENANRLCEVATTGKMPATVRIMALRMLSEWAEPSGRDQVVGVWRPVPARSAVPARQALGPRLAALIQSAPDSVRTAAIHAIANLKMADAGPLLAALATDDRQTDDTRAEALRALETLGDARRGEVAVRALSMPGADSRTQALRILAGVDPAAATSAIERTLEHGNTRERQGAFATLAALAGDASRRALSTWLDRLIEGKVAPELELDLLEAAARRRDPELAKKVDRYQAARSGSDPLAPYRPALAGGNALRGFRVFSSKADVECLRCHKIKGQGERSAIGGEVGPELTGIGSRQNREYILQSIVEPNKQIAQGFESIVLATDDGKVVTGVLRGEDDKSVRLITAEGKPLVVSKDSIDERKRGPSAMPNDLVKKLSLGELRDLIEFLASSKAETKVP